MSSLRLMQLITERLAKAFQDLNEAITMEINKKQKTPVLEQPLDQQMIQEESDKKIEEEVPAAVQDIQIQQKGKEEIQQHEQKKVIKKGKRVTLQRPKRPQNSFKIFLHQLKKQASNQEDPNFQNQITKIATKKWQNMTAEEKKPYTQVEQRQLEIYEKNLQQFYNQNPEQRNKDTEKKEIKQQKKKQKLKEKQEEKMKQKLKQKSEMNQEEKPKDISDSQNPPEKQKPKEKEKPKKEKKQKQKDAQQQFKGEVKKKFPKNILPKQAQKSSINQIPAENKGNSPSKQQANEEQIKQFTIQIQNIIRQDIFNQLQNQTYPQPQIADKQNISQENTDRKGIQELIAKPDIDSYFNLNDNSDSLGDI